MQRCIVTTGVRVPQHALKTHNEGHEFEWLDWLR
jgi:hypothetical protein